MKDLTKIIAEAPYDEMGREFAATFGEWVNTTKPDEDRFNALTFDLFKKRLDLAKKYNTFFAKQVVGRSGEPKWQLRYIGYGNEPTYSFATPVLDRTRRFFSWCEMVKDAPTSVRHWNTSYAPFPNLPGNPIPNPLMPVWSFRYVPRFAATEDGPFECRRMLYSDKFFVIEHPRSRWVAQIRMEAQIYWFDALDTQLTMVQRFESLAAFEWLWFWLNPFMRSGALTGDAMSLIVQKEIGAKMRTRFYHQDCEALLMGFNDYVAKRVNDMTNGFVEKFPMD